MMGPSADGAAGRVLRIGAGRGPPPPADNIAAQHAAGAGAPSLGGLGQGGNIRSYKSVLLGEAAALLAKPARRVAPARSAARGRPANLPAAVPIVTTRPAGAPGAGPMAAGSPPGPDCWWLGGRWVRYQPRSPARPTRDEEQPPAADEARPQPTWAAGAPRYAALLFGPAGAEGLLRDGSVAAALRHSALTMTGFDVHPILLALAQSTGARWERDHIRVPLTLSAAHQRLLARKHAAVAAALREHLPAGPKCRWRAVLVTPTRPLDAPRRRLPRPIACRSRWPAASNGCNKRVGHARHANTHTGMPACLCAMGAGTTGMRSVCRRA